MAKGYISNRQQNFKIGIASYTENSTVLDVTGNSNFSGIVTASSFVGDGSGLTGLAVSSGVGIQSNGTLINDSVTSINFVGAGNTFSVDGTTVNVNIKRSLTLSTRSGAQSINLSGPSLTISLRSGEATVNF